MATTVRYYLNIINEISRKILSQLDTQIENSDANAEKNQFVEQEIARLAAERQSHVMQLFELFTHEQLTTEIQLINDMLSFDQQLIFKAKKNKQALAEQIVKLKSGKRVSNIYQKY